jgi:regulatory protein
MVTITALKPQRNGKRVNVYLDGKFAFGIDLDNLVLSGLKIDKQFSEEEIEKIIKKAEFQKTLDKLLKFATLRPRSEKEIRDWFKRKKVHESLHKELFNRLNRLELVDDKKFAKWWVEQRIAFRPKGKGGLNYELRGKGIKQEIINEILQDSPIDEEKSARQLLEKVSYKWKDLPNREARQKKAQYLARKGFSWDVITRFLKIDQGG